MQTVLVLSPHTDDGGIGCGGTIVKLLSQGKQVYYATFSMCELSVPNGFSKDILEKEVHLSTKCLGIPLEKLLIFKYPVRRFGEFRQKILDDLIRLRDEIQPDLVLMPGQNDFHQDHAVVAAEGLRAFKHSSILCYEMVWNNLTMYTTAFVSLEQEDLDKKICALAQYTSQLKIRNYMSRDFIESLAKVRGVQAGMRYAEAYEVLRWVL